MPTVLLLFGWRCLSSSPFGEEKHHRPTGGGRAAAPSKCSEGRIKHHHTKGGGGENSIAQKERSGKQHPPKRSSRTTTLLSPFHLFTALTLCQFLRGSFLKPEETFKNHLYLLSTFLTSSHFGSSHFYSPFFVIARVSPTFCGSLIVGVVIGVVSVLGCGVCAPSISLCCVSEAFWFF